MVNPAGLSRSAGVVTGDDVRKLFEYARKNQFAIPAINVTSSSTAVAALEAAQNKQSPIILQISSSGSDFWAGNGIKSGTDKKLGGRPLNDGHEVRVQGSVAAAHFIRAIAPFYGIPVVLHTDHCDLEKLPWLDGLLKVDKEYKEKHGEALFSSHMIDLSNQTYKENIEGTLKRLEASKEAGTWLEMEFGITGGEEDGTNNEKADRKKLYTNPVDIWNIYKTLSEVSPNFSIAAAFGNVHGLYSPGAVKLRPWLLGKHQKYVKAKLENPNQDVAGGVVPDEPDDMNPDEVDSGVAPEEKNPVFLVFHGGSGSGKHEFQEGIKHGVVKVNIDTDTQFSYTLPVRNWMVDNADRLEQPVGTKANPNDKTPNKKLFDPREWLRTGEKGMAARVTQALEDFNAVGKWA